MRAPGLLLAAGPGLRNGDRASIQAGPAMILICAMVGLVDTADFSAVVADIYQASLSPAHWDTALTNLVSRFGSPRWEVAMLMWERLDPGGGSFVATAGVTPIARATYLQLFAGRNEWSARSRNLPIGCVVHSDQLIGRAEFLATDLFKQFLSMFDIQVGLIGLLDRQSRDHLGLCLPGPDNGPVELMRAAAELLIPHIQRSVRIARRIGQAELSAAHSAAGLDYAPSPVLLLTEQFELAYANSAGRAMIERYRLADAAGRIRLGQAGLQGDLQRLIDPANAQHCIAFRIGGSEAESLPALAMRIDPERIGGAATLSGQARLMVVGANNPEVSEQHVDRLRDWFGLTHAEARLATVLAEGGSIADYAALRGVSDNAARFLLKSIFAKTGTQRQAQLVQRIAASPLRWTSDLPTLDLPAPIGD